MDARRGQVYAAVYEQAEDGPRRLSDYMAEDVAEVIQLLRGFDKKVVFLGDGARAYGPRLKESGLDMLFAPAHMDIQRAAAVGGLAVKLTRSGYDEFALSYLRKAQAEREYHG
jgi:tRNA threonylcarbamoyladenosine biosynthesis protein TsaB